MAATHPLASVVNIARCPVHGVHGCRTVCFAFQHEGATGCDCRVEQVPMVPLDEYEAVVAQLDAARTTLDRMTALAGRADEFGSGKPPWPLRRTLG